MEFFALLRKHIVMCGIEISKDSKPPHKYPFNVKNSTIFILISLYTTLCAIALNEINNFDEFTNLLFMTSSFIICGIDYVIIIWKTCELFEFIDSLEDIVSKSEIK